MSERVRAGVALALLAAVGALFVFKYGHRVTAAAPWLALGYAASFVAAGWVLRRLRASEAPGWGPAAAALVGVALVMGTLWPGGGAVDRLPALEVWWERVFRGEFPYGSPIRPSGLPGLFALSLPFHLAGLARYLPAVGLAAFVVVAAKGLERANERLAVLATAALLPTTWYEVLLQSELFLNVTLALGALMAAERLAGRRLERGEAVGAGRVLAAGALLGLALSTRLVVAVAFGMYVAYRFRGRYAAALPVAASAALVAALALVPLVLWDAGRFVADGPFAVQSMYLPTVLAAALGVGALALAARVRTDAAFLFLLGAVLFVLAAASLALALRDLGVDEAIHASEFDVTYFVFCVPPLLLSLAPFSFGGSRETAAATTPRAASAPGSPRT